ncbi:hypothetical protein [Lactobacillus phage LL-H]|uniref:hypothetical protein n=1 Tax=Lactococcus phage LL-H TaxID=12348 RepID=UPI0000F6E46A|nr:hypothetical protein LPLLH_ORF109B [Lactobacillus phage LL-H]ABO60924.1 hypothetical protein [Lactobacillus phage LL-H]
MIACQCLGRIQNFKTSVSSNHAYQVVLCVIANPDWIISREATPHGEVAAVGRDGRLNIATAVVSKFRNSEPFIGTVKVFGYAVNPNTAVLFFNPEAGSVATTCHHHVID